MLTNLDLSANGISDEGTAAIAEAENPQPPQQQHNTHCKAKRHLFLQNNHVFLPDAVSLALNNLCF